LLNSLSLLRWIQRGVSIKEQSAKVFGSSDANKLESQENYGSLYTVVLISALKSQHGQKRHVTPGTVSHAICISPTISQSRGSALIQIQQGRKGEASSLFFFFVFFEDIRRLRRWVERSIPKKRKGGSVIPLHLRPDLSMIFILYLLYYKL
jgi:hypothetical protein